MNKIEKKDKKPESMTPLTTLFVLMVCMFIGTSKFEPLLMLIGFPLVFAVIVADIMVQRNKKGGEL